MKQDDMINAMYTKMAGLRFSGAVGLICWIIVRLLYRLLQKKVLTEEEVRWILP